MMEEEKIDTLISEVRELRESVDALREYLEKQFEFMLAEFKRHDEGAPLLTIVSAEKPREEFIDGAKVVVFPGTITTRTIADSSDKG